MKLNSIGCFDSAISGQVQFVNLHKCPVESQPTLNLECTAEGSSWFALAKEMCVLLVGELRKNDTESSTCQRNIGLCVNNGVCCEDQIPSVGDLIC